MNGSILKSLCNAGLTLSLAACSFASMAANQCAIGSDIPAAPDLQDTRVDAKVFDLQLVYSWSPFHCKKAGAGKSKQAAKDSVTSKSVKAWDTKFQCKRNNFGFVVHGLWPQAEGVTGKEGQPRACKDADPLSPELLRQHLCTVPGVHLMQNEWTAHGTCHWEEPGSYFGDIEKLVARFPMPALQSIQNHDVKVSEIVSAIVDGSNGVLSADMIGVRTDQVAKRRSLQEVYVCLDLDYQPKKCATRGTPGHLPAFVWPVPTNPAQ